MPGPDAGHRLGAGAGVPLGRTHANRRCRPEPLALIDWTEAGHEPAGVEAKLYYLRAVPLDPDAARQGQVGSVVGLATPELQGVAGVQSKLVERYVYDPYGKTYIEAWSATQPPGGDCDPAPGGGYSCRVSQSEFGNPFLWTGQRYDAGVGLYHFLFRSYSPELGRWMQRDPLGYVDGVSLYGYVVGGPLRYLDPIGLSACDPFRRATQSLKDKIGNEQRSLARQQLEARDQSARIGNIIKDINDKERELGQNPRDLPKEPPFPGPPQKLSQDGHRALIAILYEALRDRQTKLKKIEAEIAQTKAQIATLEAELTAAIAALEACEKAEKEAKEEAAEKLLKKGAKKGAKALAGKVPIIGIGFFAWDCYTGGVGHAVNELTWPVSEAWN